MLAKFWSYNTTTHTTENFVEPMAFITLHNYIQVNHLRDLPEFLTKLSTDNNDIKGQLFEQLTEYFLSQGNVRLYKLNEQSLIDVLTSVNINVTDCIAIKLIELCRTDIGIDFISTSMHDNKHHIHLIQSKYRSSNISLADIATFLATYNEFMRCLSSKDVICKSMLFCNQPLTSNARKMTIDNIINIAEYANDKLILALFPTSVSVKPTHSIDKLTAFFSKCKVVELKAMCDSNKVDYNRKGKKAEIVDAIVRFLS